MVIYTCPRCGYTNQIKTHMKKHFLRKKMCRPTREDVNLLYCFQQVLGENPPNHEKVTPIDSQMGVQVTPIDSQMTLLPLRVTPIDSQMTHTDSRLTPIDSRSYKCHKCDKTFSKNSNLHRHMKKCKEKSFTKEEMAEAKAQVAADKDSVISELKNQIEVLLTKVGNTTNNNTINININAYGNENMEYITSSIVNKLIEVGPYKSIPRLLKHIHFNPKHRENHNIRIPNRKEKYAKIYNGAKWELRDKKATIEDLSDKAYNLIEDHYDGKNKHMDKFINDYEDENTSKKIHTETELMILNNQNMLDQ